MSGLSTLAMLLFIHIPVKSKPIIMKKNIFRHVVIILFMLTLVPGISKGQQLGLSFSFFFPENGYFSIPISPFSFRGVGINPSRYFSLETGFTLYRMSGMNVSDIPIKTRDPLMGPFFSFFVPAQAVLKLPLRNVVFSIKGGGFAFYNFGNRINYGNLDRAIRDFENWDVANADFRFDNNLGYGWIAGAELVIYLTKQFGMNFEVNYLSGGAPLHLRGNYRGGTMLTGIQTVSADYSDSKLDYSGLEVTMGILFSSK